MPAKQVVVVKTTTSRTRTKVNGSNGKKTKTVGKKNKGNPNRCSKCGRYL